MSHQSALIEQDILSYLKQHEQKELLRFITCGSVDDGKSTLIGRLLHDSKMIYEDQLAAISKDSNRFGTTGDDTDLALLVDGLQSEREQGITIDVAYRYFSTDKRKFIIADTPGHEQYTRNMATGASSANLAIILIDARHGIMTQTRRHSFIVSLLGIRHVILAVNKMDLVDYGETAFESIKESYLEFAKSLKMHNIHVIPISALKGDNVVNRSEEMSWYQGETLMQKLETIDISESYNFGNLRFPVQYVNRPNLNFRGYAGTIASGTLNVGDEIMVLPSRKSSKIKNIVTFDGDLHEAHAPLAVTVTLEDELDISRGDMLVHPDNAPSVGSSFDAQIIWMSENALSVGRQYDIKSNSKISQGVIQQIYHRTDVNTLEKHEASTLELNEIGLCQVALAQELSYDPYHVLPATGSFIVIDRLSNITVGAGMITKSTRAAKPAQVTNVVKQETKVSKEERSVQKQQTPRIVWFTGLSGSGKSAFANALEQRLFELGKHSYMLDGDNMRLGLNKNLTFNDEDRVENIRRIGEVAKILVDAGLIVLASFISPFRSERSMVRSMVQEGEFIEVFVDTPLEICEQRDPKGLYARARLGEIENFTGISSPYEVPLSADLTLRPNKTVDEGVDELIKLMGL